MQRRVALNFLTRNHNIESAVEEIYDRRMEGDLINEKGFFSALCDTVCNYKHVRNTNKSIKAAFVFSNKKKAL